jgi:hypothetical protein
VLGALCRQRVPVPYQLRDFVGFPSCGFTLADRDANAFAAPQEIGEPITSCGPKTKVIARWAAKAKVGVSSGVGIESLAGSDAGFVFRQAEAGVKERYPKGWVDEYTFSGKLARVVELVDTTYAVASAPIIRDTGTLHPKVCEHRDDPEGRVLRQSSHGWEIQVLRAQSGADARGGPGLQGGSGWRLKPA